MHTLGDTLRSTGAKELEFGTLPWAKNRLALYRIVLELSTSQLSHLDSKQATLQRAIDTGACGTASLSETQATIRSLGHEIRELRNSILPGDRLAVATWEKEVARLEKAQKGAAV